MEKMNIRNEEDRDRVIESILHRIEDRVNERILIGMFGSMRTDDKPREDIIL